MAPASSAVALLCAVMSPLLGLCVVSSPRGFERVASGGTCVGSVVASEVVASDLVCAILCDRHGSHCKGFTMAATGVCQMYEAMTISSGTGATGLTCYAEKKEAASPTTAGSGASNPGVELHPSLNNSNCNSTQMPVGAYTMVVLNTSETVIIKHFLLCNNTSNSVYESFSDEYRNISLDTKRQATCPSSAPLYVGFSSGMGPCAVLAPSVTMNTTLCVAGTSAIAPPVPLPSTIENYFVCPQINELDSAIQFYQTNGTGNNETLGSITCCAMTFP